jgi:hypothetical protein
MCTFNSLIEVGANGSSVTTVAAQVFVRCAPHL